jgi:hypothetical protein
MSNTSISQARLRVLFPVLLALLACGPKDVVGVQRLKAIHEGMPLDSVTQIIGDGPLAPNQPDDSLRLYHGFRTQIFFVNGQNYRIVWYREEPGTVEQEITRERETPILFDGSNAVIASGWGDFDDKAAEINLPNPYRARERLDSISKAQLEAGRQQRQ